MTVLDTSVLVSTCTGPRACAPDVDQALEGGELFLIPTLVMYEWLRGPRIPEELGVQQAIFPEDPLPFGVREAELSAELYRRVKATRARQMDIAIAACAIVHECALWTLNPADFDDIPGLKLYTPPRRRRK